MFENMFSSGKAAWMATVHRHQFISCLYCANMGPSKTKFFLLIAAALGFLSFQFLQMPKAPRAQQPLSTASTTAAEMLVTSTAVTGPTEIKEAKPDVSHEKWMADMEAKYKKANERIQMYCKENLNDLQGSWSTSALQKLVVDQYKSYMTAYDQKHGLSYCRQFKVTTRQFWGQ